jgi:serine/threonine-protein kinase HipA
VRAIDATALEDKEIAAILRGTVAPPANLLPGAAHLPDAACARSKMREIQRRHWTALGKRFGALDDEGRGMEAILAGVTARTPRVIAEVKAGLPSNFPDHVAGPVLHGLELAAEELARA